MNRTVNDLTATLAGALGRMRRSMAWRDLGDLKRELLDLWTEERSAYAKEVMQDVEKQRKAGTR